MKSYIDSKGKTYADYIGAPFRHASLPHAHPLGLWVDAGLLAYDLDNSCLKAGKNHKRETIE